MDELNFIEKPFSINVELTEGCNAFCEFCGIRGMWRTQEDKQFKFMSVELAELVSKSLNE